MNSNALKVMLFTVLASMKNTEKPGYAWTVKVMRNKRPGFMKMKKAGSADMRTILSFAGVTMKNMMSGGSANNLMTTKKDAKTMTSMEICGLHSFEPEQIYDQNLLIHINIYLS